MPGSLAHRIAFLTTCVGIALYMIVSTPMLVMLGVPYVAETGNYIFKLHPGTYVLLLAAFFGLVSRGNPLAAAVLSARDHPSLALHLGGIAALFLYSICRYGPSGSAFIIETYLVPGLALMTIARFDAAERRSMFKMIIGLLVVNSLIAIGETLMRRHLVPYTVADGIVVVEQIFRSSALLGHPLNNAIVTASVSLMVLDLRRASIRVALIGLFLVALLTFGGRAAFISLIVVLGGYLVVKALVGVMASRYSYVQILGCLLIVVLLTVLFIGCIWVTGFGERIFTGLTLDDSAVVREENWQAFSYMSPGETLFGLSPQAIRHVMFQMDLDYPFQSIENPWIFMSMQFGLLGLSVLLLSLAPACWWLFQASGTGGRLALIVFFVIASTYTSIASKNCVLTLLFVSLACLTGFARERRRDSVLPRSAVALGSTRREVRA